MIKKVALIGYSGHALVVADTLQQAGYEIVGYFEKEENKSNPLQLTYLGYEQDTGSLNLTDEMSFFPAIGNNAIRSKVVNFLNENKATITTAIHPNANVSFYSEIKEGTLVCQGVCINSFAKIGKGVIINTSAIIEHECMIGDFVHIAPGAVLAGNVSIGENTFVGANAVVIQGIKIGSNVIIGAGSVVIKDIADNTTWVGNPARKIK